MGCGRPRNGETREKKNNEQIVLQMSSPADSDNIDLRKNDMEQIAENAIILVQITFSRIADCL